MPTLPGIREARIGTPHAIASLTTFAPPSMMDEMIIASLEHSNRRVAGVDNSPNHRYRLFRRISVRAAAA